MLEHDGTLWAAGINIFGQLGIDPKSNIRMINFAKIVSGGVTAVSAGTGHRMEDVALCNYGVFTKKQN